MTPEAIVRWCIAQAEENERAAAKARNAGDRPTERILDHVAETYLAVAIAIQQGNIPS